MLPGNHHGRFTGIRGSFVGSRLCVAGILWKKKTPAGNLYGRNGIVPHFAVNTTVLYSGTKARSW